MKSMKNMKTWKKLLMLVLCLLMVQAPLNQLAQPTEVHAAAKEGLVKSGGKYYFYEKGKKVTNKWKTVKGERYYFGKNGAAYAAEKFSDAKCNVEKKTVNGKRYCFDAQGRMAKGLNVEMDGTIYFCNTKTGVVVESATKKYRNAAKEKKPSKEIRALLGKPKKTEKVNSCYDQGGVGYVLTYKRYVLELFKYNATGKEIVTGLWPL